MCVPDDGGDTTDLARDLLERLLVGAEERRLEEEVLRRVAGEEELGEGHEIRVLLAGSVDALENLADVALEVTDGRVGLCQRQAQRPHATIVRCASGAGAGHESATYVGCGRC